MQKRQLEALRKVIEWTTRCASLPEPAMRLSGRLLLTSLAKSLVTLLAMVSSEAEQAQERLAANGLLTPQETGLEQMLDSLLESFREEYRRTYRTRRKTDGPSSMD